MTVSRPADAQTPDPQACPTCGGEGYRYVVRTGRNANHPIAEIPCARCAGTGLIETDAA